MNSYLVYQHARAGLVKSSPVIVYADSPQAAAAQFYNYAVVVPCWVFPEHTGEDVGRLTSKEQP